MELKEEMVIAKRHRKFEVVFVDFKIVRNTAQTRRAHFHSFSESPEAVANNKSDDVTIEQVNKKSRGVERVMNWVTHESV